MYQNLVDDRSWEVDRRIFVDPDIYNEEQDKIFAKAWLYVGHESQIKKPGDFILSKMGEESVIVVRGKDSRVRVLLNSCRHRGMKVCRYDEGNTARFYCPYHAWTYDLEGALTNVQLYDELYDPPFDKSQWSLIPVAKIAIIHGLIYATWDADAPAFEDYLGSAYKTIDRAFRPMDGGDGGIEMLGGVQKWIINSNWKIVIENAAGDSLHQPSHASVDIAGIAPSKDGRGRKDYLGKFVLSANPDGGHAAIYNLWQMDQERADYQSEPVVAEWFKEKWRKRIENMGDEAGVWPRLGCVFPNMGYLCQQPRTILVAHPIGPERAELWRTYFVDADAPPEVRAWLRRYYLSYSGPGGMTEQDDMENWQYATLSCKGAVSQRYPFHYKSGLGMDTTHPDVPGQYKEGRGSEQNARSLMNKWAQFMDAPVSEGLSANWGGQ